MNDESDLKALQEFIHENADLERLESIIDQFNIFSALRLVDKEPPHSDFLAWLLDPDGNHGLGDYFLVSFLKELSHKASSLDMDAPSVFDIDTWSFDDTEILREWENIDILLRCDSQEFVCVVENKIRTKEHSGQLKRYRDIIRRRFPNCRKMFVYLTVEGDYPSESEYLPMDHSEIASLLENLITKKGNSLSTDVLAFISHYKDMLRRYVLMDSEIQEVCRKVYKRHRRALDLIFEHRPDKQLEVSDLLKELIREDPDLELDHSTKVSVRFLPISLDFVPKQGEGWTVSKRILLFEVKNQPTRADLHLYIGPGPEEIRERLYEIARGNLRFFNDAKRSLTPKWFSIYKKTILTSKEHEEEDIESIRSILKRRLGEFKDSDLPEIESEMRAFGDTNSTRLKG